MSGTPSPPPPTLDPGGAADLRADLDESGYTVEGVADLLGPVASAALHREQRLPADLATRGSTDPAALLLRLFVLGLPVPAGHLDRALPRTGTAGLAAAGAVAPVPGRPGEVLARCDLRPYGEEERAWWVASDLGETAVGGPLPPDHVLGIGGASTTLASWTPRPHVTRALDVGTGCGVQALHLAGHVDRPVVATDVSDRALGYAAFTAALNGVGLDLRRGSLLEPVAGERFDLVVANPPFVITPRDAGVPRYEYRDGGRAGDSLVADLVRGVGEHLAPGGIAQLLGNWESAEGQDWRERVGSWLEDTGMDAWVVQREVQDPAQYAETWVRDGGHRPGTPDHEQLYAAWLADFAARGVDRVGLGVITLHRPETDRSPWRELTEDAGAVATPMGPAVLAGVRARTWLAEHGRDDLLDTAWVVAPDVTEERVGRPGAVDPAVIQLVQGGGLRRTVRLDTVTAALVGVCDGELTARQALAGIGVLLDEDPQELGRRSLPLLHGLVADGLVRRPG